jgi:hypothetical protein
MRLATWFAALCALTAAGARADDAGPRFSISFPAARSSGPLDGRLVLLLATDTASEPRLQADPDQPLKNPFMFGQTVDGMKPGQAVVMGPEAFGWPAASLALVKPGDYIVQAVLNRYATFHRADGSTVKLPPDHGEGQNWAIKPGNLYSKPLRVHLGPGPAAPQSLLLDQEIPPVADRPDSAFVRHIRIKSDRLSRFWGQPMYLGAYVLLPAGFDAHPGRPLSADGFPRAFSNRHRRLPHHAARSEPQARLFPALPPRRLQQDPAAGSLRILPEMDCAAFPAFPRRRNRTRQSVLRRQLRGELRQSRPLRRCDQLRADPGDRKTVPRPGPGLGAFSTTTKTPTRSAARR